MITASYPSSKPPAKVYQLTHSPNYMSAQEISNAFRRNISNEEWVRRDNIIKNLAGDFKGRVGDTMYPLYKKDYEEHGCVVVKGLVRSYKDIPIEEVWPLNDNPFILSVGPIKNKNVVFNCTTNWVTKNNNHLGC